MDEVNIVIRPYDEDKDQAYIYASWRNSAFYSAIKRPDDITPVAFFKKKTKKIKEILKTANVRIACFEDTPSVIAGYSVSSGTHLEFIYVKQDYRLKGIGALLMPKDIQTVTDELTKIGKVLAEKKNLKIQGEENGNQLRHEDRQADQGI